MTRSPATSLRLLAASLLLGLSAPAAAGSITVVGSLARDVQLEPGQVHRDTVRVLNKGREPVEVRAYLRDYRFRADGSNDYAEPGSLDRSNAGWIAFAPGRFEVGPGETFPLAYEVRVPTGADLRGTYWSVLMVEPVPGDPAPPSGEDGTITVRTLTRYGVQVSTRVGSGGEPGLAFPDIRMVPGPDGPAVQVDVENTGELLLTPRTWIEIFTEGGAPIGRFGGGERRVYPRCSARFEVPLGELPQGRYAALVVADGGEDHVVGSQHMLEIE